MLGPRLAGPVLGPQPAPRPRRRLSPRACVRFLIDRFSNNIQILISEYRIVFLPEMHIPTTYRKLFSRMPLGPPSTSLRGYANSAIEIVGTIDLPVRYGMTHLPSFPFHVAQRGTSLDLFISLGLSLMDNGGRAIMQVSPTMHQQWPALFDGLGSLTAFTHRPLVDPAVTPVIQPLRRLHSPSGRASLRSLPPC